jgi:predicted aldo/keto reductase-like oxidoreductase
MEEARSAGKIKHIGFSFHDSLEVFKEIIDYYDWDVCQIQYNYMDAATNFQAGTEGLKYAASKGIGVIIMEPLRGGRLANPTEEIKEIINKAPIKRTPVDWALQFLWDKPEISVVLSGMGSLQMVKENIESANNSTIGKLSKEEHEILDKMAKIYQKSILISCTKCNYCLEVCASGVNTPEIFELVNNYARNPNDKNIEKRYKKLIKKPEKVDKTKHNGAPNICTKCSKCITECPQKINIPDMLDRSYKVLEKQLSIKEAFPQK